MKKRSRAHEAGSIEAGSWKSKSIFFANRVDGAVVGQPGRAKSALGVQSEPARAPRAPRSGRSRPHRTSQGEPEAPGASKSSKPGRPRAATPGAATRPARARQASNGLVSSERSCKLTARVPDCQGVRQFRYGFGNLAIRPCTQATGLESSSIEIGRAHV